MKKFLFIACCCLLQVNLFSQTFTVDTIYYHGSTNNRINLIIMGDGYDNTEMVLFRSDAQSVADYFFGIEPFSIYKNFFNIFAVEVVSNESGVNHPGNATDEGSVSQPITVVDNYLKTTFDHGGTHRCVFSNNLSSVFNVANANVPYYDFINVIINTQYYGGCAGSVAFTTMNSFSPEVFAHEFGHMFGLLADEYDYGASSCLSGIQQRVNVSQQTDTSLLVWKKWLTGTTFPTPNGTECDKIGLYEGANTCNVNWYRPRCDCKMRDLNVPYCEICTEQFIYRISTKVNYIEGHSPASLIVKACQNTQKLFSVDILNNADSTIRVQWFVDNLLVSGNSKSYMMNAALFSPGNHQVKAVAYDTTLKAKKPLTSYNQVWNVNILNAAISTSHLLSFCAPDSAVLHSVRDASYSYQWFKNNLSVAGATDSLYSVKTSGSYSVVISNGICSDTSAVINVVVNPQPTANVLLSGNDTICSGGSSMLITNLCVGCTDKWKKNGIYINGATNDTLIADTTGSYTVEITNPLTGCSQLSQPQNIILSIINSIASANLLAICTGDSSLLSVIPSGLNYQWNRNNVSLSGDIDDSLFVQTAGTYSCYVNNGVCADTSNALAILVNQLPVVSFSGLPDSLCMNNAPVMLTPNPVGGVFIAPGISGNAFDPLISGPGIFEVKYEFTDGNGCTGEFVKNVFVDICSGVDEFNGADFIKCYLADGKKKLILQCNNNSSLRVSISLFDNTGRLVKVLSENKLFGLKERFEYDCTSLPQGAYIVNITNGKKVVRNIMVIIE